MGIKCRPRMYTAGYTYSQKCRYPQVLKLLLRGYEDFKGKCSNSDNGVIVHLGSKVCRSANTFGPKCKLKEVRGVW